MNLIDHRLNFFSGLNFTTAYCVCVTAMTNHKFMSFSTVQIYRYDLSCIHLHLSPNSQSDQLPDGLIAQSVEHCTGTAEAMGSNLVQACIFSGFNFTTP